MGGVSRGWSILVQGEADLFALCDRDRLTAERRLKRHLLTRSNPFLGGQRPHRS